MAEIHWIDDLDPASPAKGDGEPARPTSRRGPWKRLPGERTDEERLARWPVPPPRDVHRLPPPSAWKRLPGEPTDEERLRVTRHVPLRPVMTRLPGERTDEEKLSAVRRPYGPVASPVKRLPGERSDAERLARLEDLPQLRRARERQEQVAAITRELAAVRRTIAQAESPRVALRDSANYQKLIASLKGLDSAGRATMRDVARDLLGDMVGRRTRPNDPNRDGLGIGDRGGVIFADGGGGDGGGGNGDAPTQPPSRPKGQIVNVRDFGAIGEPIEATGEIDGWDVFLWGGQEMRFKVGSGIVIELPPPHPPRLRARVTAVILPNRLKIDARGPALDHSQPKLKHPGKALDPRDPFANQPFDAQAEAAPLPREGLRIWSDDGPPIQDALDEVGFQGGGTVQIPAGTYVIGAPGAPGNRPLFVWSNTLVEGAASEGPTATRLLLGKDARHQRFDGNSSACVITNSRNYWFGVNNPAQLHESLFLQRKKGIAPPAELPPPNENITLVKMEVDGNKLWQDPAYRGPGAYQPHVCAKDWKGRPVAPDLVYVAGGDRSMWDLVQVDDARGGPRPDSNERDVGGLAAALAVLASQRSFSGIDSFEVSTLGGPFKPPLDEYHVAIQLVDGAGRASTTIRAGVAQAPGASSDFGPNHAKRAKQRPRIAVGIGRPPTQGLTPHVKVIAYLREAQKGEPEPGQVPCYQKVRTELIDNLETFVPPGKVAVHGGGHPVQQVSGNHLNSFLLPLPYDDAPYVAPPGLGITTQGNGSVGVVFFDNTRHLFLGDVLIREAVSDGLMLGSNASSNQITKGGQKIWEHIGAVEGAIVSAVRIRGSGRWGISIGGAIRRSKPWQVAARFEDCDIVENPAGGVDVEVTVGTDGLQQWNVDDLTFRRCLLVDGGFGIKVSAHPGSTIGPLTLDRCVLIGQDVALLLGPQGRLPAGQFAFQQVTVKQSLVLFTNHEAIQVNVGGGSGSIESTDFYSCGLARWGRPFFAKADGEISPVLRFLAGSAGKGKWDVKSCLFDMDLLRYPHTIETIRDLNSAGVITAALDGPLVDVQGNTLSGHSFVEMPPFPPASEVLVGAKPAEHNILQKTKADFEKAGNRVVRPKDRLVPDPPLK